MMLIDKPFYDFDYKHYDKVDESNESVLNTEERTSSILARFGIGKKEKELKEMDMEELQEYGMSIEDKNR